MKNDRHAKILELIKKYEIGTQEELTRYLNEAGFNTTQTTVSRDIRKLNLIKVATSSGGQKYSVHGGDNLHPEKYSRILKDTFVSVDSAQNIMVMKTVPGMAMAAAAALDNMKLAGFVGCIAGDDTVIAVMKTSGDAEAVQLIIEEMVADASGTSR